MSGFRATDARGSHLRQWLVPLILLLAGAAVLVAGASVRNDRSAGHAVAGTTSSSGRQTNLAHELPADVIARSAPVFLSIPAIGLNTSLSRLGLNADGTVEVPTDPSQPGWFRLGPTPGQLGSSVMLGHVDSRTGPAVFFDLRNLSPGDGVIVVLADHLREHFTVRSVSTYDKPTFPARLVYGNRSHRSLNLVTCGGAFDSSTRSYLANVVVSTRLDSTQPVIGGLGIRRGA